MMRPQNTYSILVGQPLGKKLGVTLRDSGSSEEENCFEA
jgi:hypothetical protein